MKVIGITDDLFILPRHERELHAAGFGVERLFKAQASQTELSNFLKDKSGYILGGTETITREVINAANRLEAIVFTGSGYQAFIPAWQYAIQKGILIANVPDGPTHAVAEWAIAAALAMNRGFFSPASPAPGIEGQQVGIVGLGRIGTEITRKLRVFKPEKMAYYSRYRQVQIESELGVRYKALPQLLQQSDIVFLCVSCDAGQNFFSETELASMKPNALLVSIVAPGIINPDDLFAVLHAGIIRAISDYPMDTRFRELPAARWHSNEISSAFNTVQSICSTSDHATTSLINLLLHKTDPYLIGAS